MCREPFKSSTEKETKQKGEGIGERGLKPGFRSCSCHCSTAFRTCLPAPCLLLLGSLLALS